MRRVGMQTHRAAVTLKPIRKHRQQHRQASIITDTGNRQCSGKHQPVQMVFQNDVTINAPAVLLLTVKQSIQYDLRRRWPSEHWYPVQYCAG